MTSEYRFLVLPPGETDPLSTTPLPQVNTRGLRLLSSFITRTLETDFGVDDSLASVRLNPDETVGTMGALDVVSDEPLDDRDVALLGLVLDPIARLSTLRCQLIPQVRVDENDKFEMLSDPIFYRYLAVTNREA